MVNCGLWWQNKTNKKITLIGNFCGCEIGGQAEKTRILYEVLNEEFQGVKKIDVYKKNPVQILKQILFGFYKSDSIIVILASSGYLKIQWLLILLKILTGTKVYEFVIGGIRYKYLQEKKGRILLENHIDMIYVESDDMVNEYKKIGLKNVAYVPNFKKIYKISGIESQCERQIKERIRLEGLHLCTFSRIDCKKGIDTAIEIVLSIRKKTNMKVTLSIIGPIDEEYKEEFWELMQQVSQTEIEYVGKISSNVAVETIKNYDALLFCTHWETEGFPGTFIDAMAAGLPILATKRVNFQNIIKDGYNGWLIDEWDIDTYVDKILELSMNPQLLIEMKRNAIQEVKKYDAKYVLAGIIKN